MLETIAHYGAIVLLFSSLFYALLSASGVFNLLLRSIDQLSLDAPDKKSIRDNTIIAVVLLAGGLALRHLSVEIVFMVAAMAALLYQITRIALLLNRVNN